LFAGIYDEKLLEMNVAAVHNSASENYLNLIKPELYRR